MRSLQPIDAHAHIDADIDHAEIGNSEHSLWR